MGAAENAAMAAANRLDQEQQGQGQGKWIPEAEPSQNPRHAHERPEHWPVDPANRGGGK